MQKYRLFDKIAKGKNYVFYRAEHVQNREMVVVKKILKDTTWEEVLKDKNIALMNHPKVKYLSSIRQIIKDENSFYCVLENMDLNLENVIRAEIEKQDIYKMGRSLIQLIISLNEHKLVPQELRPSSLFTCCNHLNMRLAHIQAFMNRDLSKLDLVELQDLRYSSPQVVLTSKEPDERSTIFGVGLLITELILGRPLLTANTKMNYMYQLCKLFPEEHVNGQQNESKIKQIDTDQTFDTIMSEFDISNEFIALLKEMLKVDRNQRINIADLHEAYDLIVANEENFKRQTLLKNQEANQTIKPNINQAPINKQILSVQIDFDFERKPTLSTIPTIKTVNSIIPVERNVDDDTVQPIIIKKSSKNDGSNQFSMPVTLNKDIKLSRSTKQQTLTSIRRPQLTNYALNESNNLGVKLGFNPTLFSDNENDF